MSTPAVARVSAGVPTGGQFAPCALTESTVVLDGRVDTGAQLQPWGEQPDAQIDAAAWHGQQDLDEDERDISELLGVVANADGTGALSAVSHFSDGDEPQIRGKILSQCPEPQSTNDTAIMSPWEELEGRLTDALETWVKNLEDGDHDTDFADLIGDDEDTMIAAYGQGRSDYLCGLAFHADAQNWWVSGGLHEPNDGGINGHLKVAFGGRQLATSKFSEQDPPDISGLLDRCVTAPDGSVTVHTERRGPHGPIKEIHNPSTGELNDGPDDAASRSYDRDGGLREKVHYDNGVKHGTSLTIAPDGSTVHARYERSVVTDGPNLEPAIKTMRPDGSIAISHHPNGDGAHTTEYDASDRRTSQTAADAATGGSVRTDFDATGRAHATRRDANGVEQDGPNGEPAVDFRRPDGTVSSQTWYTNGAWTRTCDYNREGETVVEFTNS